MGPLTSILAEFVFVAMAVQSPVVAQETLAQPVKRAPPAYPVQCAADQGGAVTPQHVKVIYDVGADGKTERVGVAETTDECFNEAAVAAVEDWEFKPRMVNATPQPQRGLTSTLAFVLEGDALDEFRSRPARRVPPTYPSRCMTRAEAIEFVTIRFDVSTEGSTENIAVIDSTNDCFENAAVKSVEQWRYNPEIVNGQAVVRTGLEQTITFQTE